MSRPAALIVALVALAGCADDGAGAVADAETPTDGWPEPSDDLVTRVGTDDAVDIATWNIQNFPKLTTSPRFVADLITSIELDLIAVEEIADVNAFDELVARLPKHAGLLSSHEYSPGEYQKVGFIYRDDYITLSDPVLLFEGETYEFPRPPLQVTVGINAGATQVEFTAIVVHLKAGIGTDDRDRRTAAMISLEAHVRELVNAGQTEVLLLGDFNEVMTDPSSLAVYAPFGDDQTAYRLRTFQLAAVGGVSWLPGGRMLDHVISTAAMDDEFGEDFARVSRLDQEFNAYDTAVSDHLPVIVSLPVLQ